MKLSTVFKMHGVIICVLFSFGSACKHETAEKTTRVSSELKEARFCPSDGWVENGPWITNKVDKPKNPTVNIGTVVMCNNTLRLTFLRGQYGARLYRVEHVSKGDILYQNYKEGDRLNGAVIVKTNKGRTDEQGKSGYPFLVIGGLESAYPNQEHGEIGAQTWEYIEPTASTLSYEAWFDTKSRGVIRIITTLTRGSSASFTQEVKLENLDPNNTPPYMYYTNVMLDAGWNAQAGDEPNKIEVLFPPGVSNSDFIVHAADGSRTGVAKGMDGGAWDNTGPKMDYYSDPDRKMKDESWRFPNNRDAYYLGYFYSKPVTKFGFYNDTGKYGLKVEAEPNHKIWSKFFCGYGLTSSMSTVSKAYCEMWFSPNAPSFWHWPDKPETVKHKVTFTVLTEPGEF